MRSRRMRLVELSSGSGRVAIMSDGLSRLSSRFEKAILPSELHSLECVKFLDLGQAIVLA